LPLPSIKRHCKDLELKESFSQARNTRIFFNVKKHLRQLDITRIIHHAKKSSCQRSEKDSKVSKVSK
jgi:hypothetical protein